jgi:peptidoglycan/xylan/chitin deacetylase (PgdA/CDA1 family)
MIQLFRTGLFHVARWPGMAPIVRRAFAARAAVLMFHEIQPDSRAELNSGVSAEFFESSLNWLRQEGWEIVSLDACLDRLAMGPRSSRYAVLTFDDGYRDNVTTALPIMERYRVPFTVYVPTDALTRTLQSWWLGLRELMRVSDAVTIDAMGSRFSCPDFDSKIAALSRVTKWIHEDFRRAATLAPAFKKAGVSLAALNDRYFLDGRELQALSRHQLASIGAHTTSHPALAHLDARSARAEMADNRNYLEELLQLPVRHIAFPYGSTGACGPREELLAQEVGFSSAATTRHAQLSERNLNPFSLPRLGVGGPFDTKVAFEARMNGLQSAVRLLLGNA